MLRTLFLSRVFALQIAVLAAIALPVHAFEPLNTDDAGTVGKRVNQIEQYFYVLHNNVAGNPGSVATLVRNLGVLGMPKPSHLPTHMAFRTQPSFHWQLLITPPLAVPTHPLPTISLDLNGA